MFLVTASWAIQGDGSAQPLKGQEQKVSTKIYENSNHPFPENLDGLKNTGHIAGGSGGVTIIQDQKGQKFTMKCASQTTQLKEEIMADALYRAMGIRVPGFAVYNDMPENLGACQGQPLVRVSRFIDSNSHATDAAKTAALAKGFVADAFMSNWDIVVGGLKNVVMDSHGKIWRIDNGGSLRYRALGEAKTGHPDWDPEKVNDLDTMHDSQKNPDGARVYGGLTPEELKTQAQIIISRAPQILKTFEALSRAIDLENPEELRAILTGRLHDLASRFGLSLPTKAPDQVTPSTYFASSTQKPTAQTSAGILIYSLDPQSGKPMILLGKRIRHNWWGNFGRKSDVDPTKSPIDQTLLATAIRETREESQEQLIFSPYQLQQSPSHDLINPDGSLFRMYITPTHYLFPQNIPLTGPHTQEYTEFQWLPLEDIWKALQPSSPRIKEEGQETVKIGTIILHAPLYRMLMEPAVQIQLKQILNNPQGKLRAIRTKTGHKRQEKVTWAPIETSQSLEKVPFGFNAAGQIMGNRSLKGVTGSEETVPFNPAQQEEEFAKTIARKAQLAGEIKSNRRELKSSIKPVNKVTDTEPQKALAGTPYTASDAYLKLMMGEDYDANKNDVSPLINKFFDQPYTKFGKIQPFENPVFRNAVSEALRQERLHKGWYVFYHGTDAKMAFLYDILSTYRARFQALHGQTNPRFRFLDQPFIGLENVQEFKEFFGGSKNLSGGIDNYIKDFENKEFKEGTLGKRSYQDMGLSVNVSLFGSDNVYGSSSIQFFAIGASLLPPDYKALFNAVRLEIGFDKTWEDFQPLFEEYQRNTGRLYQIFISPDALDQIGYLSHSRGIPMLIHTQQGGQTDSLTYALNILRSDPESFVSKVPGLPNVQARLFLKPEIFYNPKAVQVKIYDNRIIDSETIKAYRKRLDDMVSEDVAKWILKHEKLSTDVVQGDNHPIEQLAQETHKGETGTPYKTSDKELKKINQLKGLLENEDTSSIREFLDQNPDYPINKPIYFIDYYRPSNSLSLPPLWYVFEKIKTNRSELLKLLIEKGASVLVKNKGRTLWDKALEENNLDLINFILDQPSVDINAQDDLGESTIFTAVRAGNVQLTNFLLDKGASVTLKNKIGRTPLHLAVMTNSLEITQRLLDVPQTDINAQDDSGESAIFITVRNRDVRLTNLLLDKEVSVTLQNKRGETPLHVAVMADSLDITQRLLSLSQIDINAQDRLGNTALHYAAKAPQENAEIIQNLLSRGSLVHLSNLEGDTPLSIAAKEGHLGVIQTVITYVTQYSPFSSQITNGSLRSVKFDLTKYTQQEISNFLRIPSIIHAIREATFSGGTIQGIIEICTSLPQLTSLIIKDNNIGDADARILSQSTVSSKLTLLDLSGNNIEDAGAEAITTLKNLHTLNLSDNSIGATGAGAIATLKNLHTLNLSFSNIGAAGAEAIVQLKGLHTLNLSNNNIGDAGAKEIATMKNLHTLNLSYNSIGDAGAKDIAQLKGLHTLDLSLNRIGDAGAKDIAQLKGLHTINLYRNNIGAVGAKAIAQLKGLHTLNLSHNYNIEDESATAIAQSPYLSNLTSLSLGGNNISVEIKKQLEDKFGKRVKF